MFRKNFCLSHSTSFSTAWLWPNDCPCSGANAFITSPSKMDLPFFYFSRDISRLCSHRRQKRDRKIHYHLVFFIYFLLSTDPFDPKSAAAGGDLKSREITFVAGGDQCSREDEVTLGVCFQTACLVQQAICDSSIMCRDIYIKSNFWHVSPLVCKPWNNEDLPESLTRDERA